MRKIRLTQNKFTLVDNKDFKYLKQFQWQYYRGYAKRGKWDKTIKNNRTIFMHSEILKTPKGFLADHVNGIKLDNRRKNLRIANYSQNGMNKRMQKNNKSGYTGVSWDQTNRKWTSRIKVNNKYLNLGYFINKTIAHQAYIKASKIYFKEFRRIQ